MTAGDVLTMSSRQKFPMSRQMEQTMRRPAAASSARRSLFGKPNPEETTALLNEINEQNYQRFRQRYNFDIRVGRPINDSNIFGLDDISTTQEQILPGTLSKRRYAAEPIERLMKGITNATNATLDNSATQTHHHIISRSSSDINGMIEMDIDCGSVVVNPVVDASHLNCTSSGTTVDCIKKSIVAEKVDKNNVQNVASNSSNEDRKIYQQCNGNNYYGANMGKRKSSSTKVTSRNNENFNTQTHITGKCFFFISLYNFKVFLMSIRIPFWFRQDSAPEININYKNSIKILYGKNIMKQ